MEIKSFKVTTVDKNMNIMKLEAYDMALLFDAHGFTAVVSALENNKPMHYYFNLNDFKVIISEY